MLATAGLRGGAADRASRRLAAVDGLRGLALCGMALFHTVWDLAWVGALPGAGRDIPVWWQAFGDAVAALFLLVSGLSLILARRRGATITKIVRRLGIVLVAALAITVLSTIVVPGMAIDFGILHCIVAGDLLALALIDAPLPAPLALAAVLFLLPALPLGGAMDQPFWGWIGLGAVRPDTLDYRPIFPWAGFALAGLAAGRLMPEAMLRLAPQPPRWLAFAGRHSLPIYLGHQAVLFPAAALLALALGIDPQVFGHDDWTARFEAQCTADCGQSGAGPALCRSVCRCAAQRIAEAGLASAAPSGMDHGKLGQLTESCFRSAVP